MKPLTTKQCLFIEEYMTDQNATQAYMRVYQCEYKSACTAGPRMLENVVVSAEIKRQVETIVKKSSLNIEEVLHRLAIIADSSLDDFLVIDEITGRATIDLSRATAEQREAIAEYQVDEVVSGDGETIQRKTKIKMKDDLVALKMVGTYLKMFSEAQRRVTEATGKILREVRDGIITIEQAAYEFAILGEPLPEVLKIKLTGLETPPVETKAPFTNEELELRQAAMQAQLQKQRESWLPERQETVAALKSASRAFDGN